MPGTIERLRALLSSPKPDPVREKGMRSAIDQVSREMPDVAAELNTMKPYQQGNIMDRLLFPKGAYAVTMPFSGRMMYNPDTLPNDPQMLLDTLSHEGEHARQMKGLSTFRKIAEIMGSMATPYEDRWQEKEARSREQRAHELRLRKDINLPSSPK